ncbi:MAG: EAL domain-containing protein [Campylobacterales bacterium]
MFKKRDRDTTYTTITIKIILGMLAFTILSSYIYSEYVKDGAIENLAHIDAKKTSLLAFEAIYVAMSNGMDKNEIDRIIKRLNNINPKLDIAIYRSNLVESLFGQRDNHKDKESYPKLLTSLQGQEVLFISPDDKVKYYYPVKAKSECLECHINAKIGDTLGVIKIEYPTDEMKISLFDMINFFIVFVVAFSLVVFLALFVNFNNYLLRPIKEFVALIDSIKTSKDIKQRVAVKDNIKEIKSMQTVFNEMLDSIENNFYNDELTNLKNRRSLIEDIDESDEGYLMIINIDSFKEINNLYGNKIGDSVLLQLSSYLEEMIDEEKKLYRLHADEFAYLTTRATGIEEFEELASFLITKISSKKFSINQKEDISLCITIGISYGSKLLLPNADIALKLAKKDKKHQLTYDDSMKAMQKYEQNINWTKKLNTALEENRIEPIFQPIAECQSGEIFKYESLMRIKDENGEYISPIHFLELSKKNKLYTRLTEEVVRKTFRAFENTNYNFSINLSIEDILNKDVNAYILEQLDRSKASSRAVMEITESEGIEEFDEVIKFIDETKKRGAKVSIDDFGTGYSNFEYLLKLNIDYIKIDGSLIKNIDSDDNSRFIVQTIVDFARKIGVKTVAEFVYSKAIFDIVKSMGIDYAQGYYFGQPSPKINQS